MNKVILMGRLTRDPEVRYSQGATATAIARFSIAVDRRFKRDGEPDADFIFLHTHTWAYKAVGMYQKMGFRITKKALPTSRTDFSCMDVLKDVLPNSIIAQLLEKD